jgi:hypothetical protein
VQFQHFLNRMLVIFGFSADLHSLIGEEQAERIAGIRMVVGRLCIPKSVVLAPP